ncbi:MAG: GHKL domain-containing protein [Lachnospiraceae bacterium]|nr:GHKL domain-containing protein [Lachnospiraceae bacterium]
MSIVYQVAIFIITVLETGLGFAFFHLLTGSKYEKKWKWVVEDIGILLAGVGWFCNRQFGLVSNNEIILYTVICFFIVTILGNKQRLVSLGIFLIYFTTDELFILICGVFFACQVGKRQYLDNIHFGPVNIWRMIAYFIAFTVIFCIYVVCRKQREYFWVCRGKILIFLGASEWLIFTWALGELFLHTAERSIWTLGILLFLAVSIVIIIVAYIHNLMVQSERQLAELKNELLKKNYYETKQLLENNMITFHDWKNHMLILKEYASKGDIDKIKAYLNRTGSSVDLLSQYIWNENEVINVIVNTKIIEAKRNNIKLDIEVENALQGVAEYDLCSILANLLDNSIEACVKLSEDKRWIKLIIRQISDISLIKIINSVGEKQGEDIQDYKSSKHGNHGYGLSSIRGAVEKYKGTMTIKRDDTTFSVTITFFGGK